MKVLTILSVIAVKYCIFIYMIIHVVRSETCNTVCEYEPDPIGFADCTSRSFSAIPPECSSSTYLDMTGNELHFVDKTSLAGFGNLMYVYLEENNIGDITPGAFLACGKLRDIFLLNNPLVTLQNNTFIGLSNLRNLYAGNTELLILEPDAFAGLPSLMTLHLNDNKLRTLPGTVFHSLRRLQYLMLPRNQLQSIHRAQFHNLNQLKLVDLQENQIMRIGSGVFTGLLSLTSLNISSNEISVIETGAFDFTVTVNLELIDLTNNNIISTKTMPTGLGDIQNVFYAQNPMICDCDSLALMEWYQNHKSSLDVKADVICQGPRELDGAYMRNISENVINRCTSVSRPTKIFVMPTITAKDNLHSSGSSHTFQVSSQTAQVTANRSVIPPKNGLQQQNNDMNDDSKLFMYVGVAAVIACIIVTVIGMVIVCKWYGVSHRTLSQLPEDPPPKPTFHITPNPLIEPTSDFQSENEDDEDEDEDEVYEMISGRTDVFPNRRSRKISEMSVDSAYSEGSSPDSIDHPPPSYPPPPPPHQSLSGYIPFYQSKNGQVYLCTRCPHDSFVTTSQPVLMHSVSVPVHCSDLANLPTIHRQNSLPESATTQNTHYIPCTVQAPTSDQHVRMDATPTPETPAYQEIGGKPNYPDSHPIPLQTDTAHYTRIDLSSYPSTNPFANVTT